MRENTALAEVLELDSEIVALSELREQTVAELQRHVHQFIALERAPMDEGTLYHRVLGVVYQLCADILACERADLSRDEIVQVLDPVRRVHARSPFVARLQQWPRGYPGDFETVEYLVGGQNRAQDPMARACEAYALTRSIAQQHRNKVQHQAERIVRAMRANPGASRIASIACGSCPDLRSILEELPALAGELWLNDMDAGALAFSRAALEPVAGHCEFRDGDALSAVRRMPRNAFDLVLAGGLYDYLSERTATILLQMVYRILAPGGTFFFTNIAAGNPYRPLIEYFGDWSLIERTEEDVYRACENAGFSRSNVKIERDATGLALLVEVSKVN